MKLKDYKQQSKFMDQMCGMVKTLEYSELNTLSSDRKDLHRNFIIPMMDKEHENYNDELKGIEEELIDMGFKNPDEVDIDELFERLDVIFGDKEE